jgi:hypothetical protein
MYRHTAPSRYRNSLNNDRTSQFRSRLSFELLERRAMLTAGSDTDVTGSLASLDIVPPVS